jgi:hypothetical protein
MSDKSQETDFLYDVGDFVTYNFTKFTNDDDGDITEYAVIVGRRIVDVYKMYQVVWLDNHCEVYGDKEYEYLENQIKKVENNV